MAPTSVLTRLQGPVALPLLLDVNAYNPATFDWLSENSPVPFAEWVAVFRNSMKTFGKVAAEDPSFDPETSKAKSTEFVKRYESLCDRVLSDPHGVHMEGYRGTPPEPIRLCYFREQYLLDVGFTDIFRPIKQQENNKALKLLPQVCSEIDGIAAPSKRWELLLKGVFAGNIFDLGAAASTQLFESGQAAFHSALQRLLPRPWVVDNCDEAVEQLCHRGYKRVLMFLDNAGSDTVLGMLPFAREFLRQGAHVILSANELASINDMTIGELHGVVHRAGQLDDVIRDGATSGKLQLVSNGNGLPVIDLTKVSHDVSSVSAGCDLVVLEGMGRAIETNLHAAFLCDSLKLGMIKHPEVAKMLGGRLYDPVCKFDRAGEP